VVLTAAGDGGRSWVADQRRLAELLSARQVVRDDSRHLMMLDRPDVVADALRSLITPKETAHD
jgi:pimeloyl-ACP methyl ester carboxylesterase